MCFWVKCTLVQTPDQWQALVVPLQVLLGTLRTPHFAISTESIAGENLIPFAIIRKGRNLATGMHVVHATPCTKKGCAATAMNTTRSVSGGSTTNDKHYSLETKSLLGLSLIHI